MSEHPLSSEAYEMFGKIINRYADLETLLVFTIGVLLDMDPGDVVVVTDQYNSVRIRSVLRSALHARKDHFAYMELQEILKYFEDVAVLRNHIAHDRWVLGSAPDAFVPLKLGVRKHIPGAYSPSEEYSISRLNGAYILLETSCVRTVKVIKDAGWLDRLKEY